ncbi:hypothetical protein PROFUN_12366 [Planoprotostelium fungivorum]|uniref:Uncharacterized protein n=1 Tax=Planoprotostelium fungivorum TaxID=1890364 RepID=A0A2P6N7F4_9EUKA|nr:hypothetical protein PROFUN_12366 [Planoprotostelium fungivorum]
MVSCSAASGISSSNINQCSSNAVTTSVYYGSSCSGKASNQASNNLNQCNQNSEGTGSTEISCLASFLYTGNSSSDGLTVTFSGTSCQGKAYSILVVPGLLTSNSTKCTSSACVKTNYGTSTRFVCGNSTSLPGYVQSLNSATNIMFSGMIIDPAYHISGTFTIIWCYLTNLFIQVNLWHGTEDLQVYRFRDDQLFNSLTAAINQGYGTGFIGEDIHKKMGTRGDPYDYIKRFGLSTSFGTIHVDCPPWSLTLCVSPMRDRREGGGSYISKETTDTRTSDLLEG